MATKPGPGTAQDAEQIVGAALVAFGRGAGHRWMNRPAIQTFRSQFGTKICTALEQPDWHEDWQRERVYLFAYAEAMGKRAAALAEEEGRAVITHQDVDEATAKLRGYMPIAGRWCPL